MGSVIRKTMFPRHSSQVAFGGVKPATLSDFSPTEVSDREESKDRR